MAGISGKSGFVEIDGTPVCAAGWEITIEAEETDVTDFCSSTGNYRSYVPGFKSVSGSFTTLDFLDLVDETGSGDFGNDSGTYSGNIIILSHTATNPVDGRFEQVWNFRGDGDFTLTPAT